MVRPKLILLSGLHGTADLFPPFLKVIPRDFQSRICSYPGDRKLTYDDLLGLIERDLQDEPSVVLIAESFSGPLAIRYAAKHSDRVRAIVLCASFIRSPQPRWLYRLLAPVIFRLPPSNWLLRHFLAGRDATSDILAGLRDAIRSTRPSVLAHRMIESLNVDVATDLARRGMPLLYLRARNDKLLGESIVRQIEAIRPDVVVREIGGPHLLLATRPLECWGEIEQFLGHERGDDSRAEFCML